MIKSGDDYIKSLKEWGNVVYYNGQAFVVQGTSPATAYATGVAAGTRGQDCAPWTQIQSAMQRKFPVPEK